MRPLLFLLPALCVAIALCFAYRQSKPTRHAQPVRSSVQVSTPPSIETDHHTILSYNIRVDVDPAPLNWSTRRAHVLRVILSARPDIVCLQEACVFSVDYLLRHMQEFQVVGAKREKHYASEWCPILYNSSRYTNLSTETILMSLDPHSWSCGKLHCRGRCVMGGKEHTQHPRSLTLAKFQDRNNGVVFYVVNTHFPLLLSHRKVCAEILAQFLRRNLSLESSVVFVAGDFNSNEHPNDQNGTIAHMQNQFTALNIEIRDPFNFADISTHQEFATGARSAHRIDYIMYVDALGKVASTTASIVESRYRNGKDMLSASDHQAVVMRCTYVA